MEKTGRMESITIVQVCVPTYGIVTNHRLSVEGTGECSLLLRCHQCAIDVSFQ